MQIWWKCAIIVAIVMIYVTAFQIYTRWTERKLQDTGILVNARIVQLEDRKVGTGTYHPQRDNDLYVKLEGFPDGKTREGTLKKADGFAELGGHVQLRVDPKDQDHWVEVRPDAGIKAELMAVFLLLPVIVLLLAIARWRRQAVLKVWRLGDVETGVIVDSRHSSMAPRSRTCRYTLANPRDPRVFTMLHPNSHGLLREGDALAMIALPGQPERAIVADLYMDLSGRASVSAEPTSGEPTLGEPTSGETSPDEMSPSETSSDRMASGEVT